MSYIMGVEPEPKQVHCVTRVEVAFEDISNESALPKSRPATT